MRIPETALNRRVHVAFALGIAMVAAMMRRPPQGSALRRAATEKGQQETYGPGRAVGGMGEQAVKTRGDAECPQEVEHGRDDHGGPAHTGVDGAEAGQVKGDHSYDYDPSLLLRLSRCGLLQSIPPGLLAACA